MSDREWAQISPLRRANRKAGGASPTAGAIDGQSVKTTQSGGVRGFYAGTKIKGRKRHILTDTRGLLVGLVVHGATKQAGGASRE